jgi:RimJ/RimL family protein N-acetyltransferase
LTLAATGDGHVVRVRPIEPSDASALEAGFEALSYSSRYKRFLSPMSELSESAVHYLTEVDHHDHEALIAVDPDSDRAVAVARYVRNRQTDPRSAEVAVTVVDDWQGRGVGTLLLGELARRARKDGVERFTALVLANNHEMLDLLHQLGPCRVVSQETGVVELEVELGTTRGSNGRR